MFSGYVHKRSTPISPPAMQRVYSVLWGTLLMDYENEEESKTSLTPRLCVEVLGVSEWDGRGRANNYPFGFLIVTHTGTTYYVSVPTLQERIDWVLYLKRGLECVFANPDVAPFKPSKILSNRPPLVQNSICPNTHNAIARGSATLCRSCGIGYYSAEHVMENSTILQIGAEETEKVCKHCHNCQAVILWMKSLNYIHAMTLHEVTTSVLQDVGRFKASFKLRRRLSPRLELAADLLEENSITLTEFEELRLVDHAYRRELLHDESRKLRDAVDAFGDDMQTVIDVLLNPALIDKGGRSSQFTVIAKILEVADHAPDLVDFYLPQLLQAHNILTEYRDSDSLVKVDLLQQVLLVISQKYPALGLKLSWGLIAIVGDFAEKKCTEVQYAACVCLLMQLEMVTTGYVSAIADVPSSALLSSIVKGAMHQQQEIGFEIGALFLVRRRLQEVFDNEEQDRARRILKTVGAVGTHCVNSNSNNKDTFDGKCTTDSNSSNNNDAGNNNISSEQQSDSNKNKPGNDSHISSNSSSSSSSSIMISGSSGERSCLEMFYQLGVGQANNTSTNTNTMTPSSTPARLHGNYNRQQQLLNEEVDHGNNIEEGEEDFEDEESDNDSESIDNNNHHAEGEEEEEYYDDNSDCNEKGQGKVKINKSIVASNNNDNGGDNNKDDILASPRSIRSSNKAKRLHKRLQQQQHHKNHHHRQPATSTPSHPLSTTTDASAVVYKGWHAFTEQLDFVHRLTKLVDDLRNVDRSHRTSTLCAELIQWNDNPADKLGWDPIVVAGEPFYRIMHICIEDCRVFRTKARAPTMIVCEVLRDDLVHYYLEAQQRGGSYNTISSSVSSSGGAGAEPNSDDTISYEHDDNESLLDNNHTVSSNSNNDHSDSDSVSAFRDVPSECTVVASYPDTITTAAVVGSRSNSSSNATTASTRLQLLSSPSPASPSPVIPRTVPHSVLSHHVATNTATTPPPTLLTAALNSSSSGVAATVASAAAVDGSSSSSSSISHRNSGNHAAVVAAAVDAVDLLNISDGSVLLRAVAAEEKQRFEATAKGILTVDGLLVGSAGTGQIKALAAAAQAQQQVGDSIASGGNNSSSSSRHNMKYQESNHIGSISSTTMTVKVPSCPNFCTQAYDDDDNRSNSGSCISSSSSHKSSNSNSGPASCNSKDSNRRHSARYPNSNHNSANSNNNHNSSSCSYMQQQQQHIIRRPPTSVLAGNRLAYNSEDIMARSSKNGSVSSHSKNVSSQNLQQYASSSNSNNSSSKDQHRTSFSQVGAETDATNETATTPAGSSNSSAKQLSSKSEKPSSSLLTSVSLDNSTNSADDFGHRHRGETTVTVVSADDFKAAAVSATTTPSSSNNKNNIDSIADKASSSSTTSATATQVTKKVVSSAQRLLASGVIDPLEYELLIASDEHFQQEAAREECVLARSRVEHAFGECWQAKKERLLGERLHAFEQQQQYDDEEEDNENDGYDYSDKDSNSYINSVESCSGGDEARGNNSRKNSNTSTINRTSNNNNNRKVTMANISLNINNSSNSSSKTKRQEEEEEEAVLLLRLQRHNRSKRQQQQERYSHQIPHTAVAHSTTKQTLLSLSSDYWPAWDVRSFIVKSNDDLRQEVCCLQLMQICKEVFDHFGLSGALWLKPYRIISTGSDTGLVQVLTDAMSLDALKKTPGFHSLSQYFTQTYGSSEERLRVAKMNFVSSLAAYSLFSYILQIKDRHNGNLMIDTEGHIIHIDFGFLLGIAPGGSFSLETAPFKLTEEMVELLGGLDSPLFGQFLTAFTKGFIALQSNAENIVSALQVLSHNSTFPCFIGKQAGSVIEKLRGRFRTELSVNDAVKHCLDLITNSYGHYGTRQYDTFQWMTNGIMP